MAAALQCTLLQLQRVPHVQHNERFSKRKPVVCPQQIPDATGLIPANIENGLSVGTDCLIMLGILIGMRFVTYLQMTIAIKFHKL